MIRTSHLHRIHNAQASRERSRGRLHHALRAVLIFSALAALADADTLHAQVAGELRGRVTDASTARPIVNGQVEVGGGAEIARTNADGTYVLRGLEPRVYSVTIRALGYGASAWDIRVTNGRSTVLDATLERTASLLDRFDVRASRDSAQFNTTVISRALIEQSGRRDLGELLQTTAGVVVTQAGGPGQPSSVSIRGSTSGQVLVLLDGVPLNSALTGGADLSHVALEDVERVTVRTGAQSARYGPRAMAGVIEIESRRTRHEVSTLLRTGALGEREASLAGGKSRALGASTVSGTVAADYRTIDGDFAFTLPAVRGGGPATRINADATSREVVASTMLDAAAVNATVRGSWERSERGLAGSIVQPSSTGRQGHERMSAGVNAQGLLHRVGWTAAADITNERGTFIDRTPPFGEAYDDTIATSGANVSMSATASGASSSAAIGAELRTLDVTSTMLSANAPHSQSLVGEWATIRAQRIIALGVTWDGEVTGRLDENSLNGGTTISPRAATRISRQALSMSLSVGSGYAPPTLSDQFFHEGVQVKANPSLRAERTRNDLEVRLTLREVPVSFVRIAADVASYRSDIDGMILWFPDFRFIWSPSNYDVHRNGWEATTNLSVPQLHIDVQGITNRNNVVYAGGVLAGQVAYRPRATESVHIGFAPSPVRIDFTTRYVGTRRTIAGSGLNALDPYWISDVRASHTFSMRSWALQSSIGIENALNQEAAMLVDYPFPPRTWSASVRVRRSTAPTH